MILGQKRYDEFWYYYDHNYGVNSKKALLIFSSVVVPLTLVCFLMIYNTVQRITPENIQYSGFTELNTTTYRYDQVTKIEWVKSFKAPNGNIVRDPYYVIHFADQQDWSLRDTLADLTQAQQQEIAQYIAQKSNLEMTIIDPYPR